ncbi:hypothetical protein PENTCL1PPCAC_4028, partial [Pristionchus entomophagus]
MEGYLNLASLPPDIIRGIISIEEESTNDLRQISHSWNSLVKERIAGRSHPLDRVYLRLPPLPRSLFVTYSAPPNTAGIDMHALIPSHFTKRVGIGIWLSQCSEDGHNERTIEVKSIVDRLKLIPESGGSSILWIIVGLNTALAIGLFVSPLDSD